MLITGETNTHVLSYTLIKTEEYLKNGKETMCSVLYKVYYALLFEKKDVNIHTTFSFSFAAIKKDDYFC